MQYQLLENVGYDEGVCLTSVRRIKNNQERPGHMTEQNSVEVLPKENLQEQKDPRVQRKEKSRM